MKIAFMNMRSALAFLFFLLGNFSHAQQQRKLDSLQQVIQNATGIAKYSALHSLAVEYLEVDNETALQLVEDAEYVVLATLDTASIVENQQLKAQILFKLGRPQEAIAVLRPVLQFENLRKTGEEYLNVTNLLAVSYMIIGEFDKALEYGFETNEIANKINDEEYVAISLKNIGITYYKLKDYRKALPFMLESYRKERSLDIRNFATPMNISLCYTHLGDYDNAKLLLSESISICGENCGILPSLHIEYTSGSIFFGLKKYLEAESAFLKSLNFSKRIGDHRMQLDNIYMLAKICITTKDLKKAEHYLKKGESLVKAGTPFNVEMIKVYGQLSELYLRTRNFERASFYQSKYIQLKDSVYNEVVTTNLMKIESRYLQKENEAKIAVRDEMILLREQSLYRQTLFNIVVSLFALTAIAFIVHLIKSYRIKKNANRVLEEKIRERTHELDIKVQSLVGIVHEREIELNRFTILISETINSLEGLARVAGTDTSDANSMGYLKSIHHTISRLVQRRNVLILRKDIRQL